MLLPFGCPRRAFNDFPLRDSFTFNGSSDEVGKWNGHIFISQIILGNLNKFNTFRFALPIRRQVGGYRFRTETLLSF